MPPGQVIELMLQNLRGGPFKIVASRCQLLGPLGEPLADLSNAWISGWSVSLVLRMTAHEAQRLVTASDGAWALTAESDFLQRMPCEELPDAVLAAG